MNRLRQFLGICSLESKNSRDSCSGPLRSRWSRKKAAYFRTSLADDDYPYEIALKTLSFLNLIWDRITHVALAGFEPLWVKLIFCYDYQNRYWRRERQAIWKTGVFSAKTQLFWLTTDGGVPWFDELYGFSGDFRVKLLDFLWVGTTLRKQWLHQEFSFQTKLPQLLLNVQRCRSPVLYKNLLDRWNPNLVGKFEIFPLVRCYLWW